MISGLLNSANKREDHSHLDSMASIDDVKVKATIKLANTPGNHCYLIYWSLMFSLASYAQVGYIIGENLRARYIVAA